MVLRTFPIRVAGHQAGPLHEEIDWDTVQRESGYPTPIAEYTTVTGKLRRVGRFDYELLARAVAINRPTELAFNFVDYLDYRNRRARSSVELSGASLKLISKMESVADTPIKYIGVGPNLAHTFQCLKKQFQSQVATDLDLHGRLSG